MGKTCSTCAFVVFVIISVTLDRNERRIYIHQLAVQYYYTVSTTEHE